MGYEESVQSVDRQSTAETTLAALVIHARSLAIAKDGEYLRTTKDTKLHEGCNSSLDRRDVACYVLQAAFLQITRSFTATKQNRQP